VSPAVLLWPLACRPTDSSPVTPHVTTPSTTDTSPPFLTTGDTSTTHSAPLPYCDLPSVPTPPERHTIQASMVLANRIVGDPASRLGAAVAIVPIPNQPSWLVAGAPWAASC